MGTLRASGPERVLSHLAGHWADAARVTVLSFDPPERRPFFPFDARVVHVPLGAPPRPIHHRSLRSFFHAAGQVRALRRALRARRGAAPATLVSFCAYYNLVALAASVGLGMNRVVAEHTHPSTDSFFLRRLRPALYLLADRITVLGASAARRLPPWLRSRTRVIPNPAVRLPADAPASPRPFLLGVGRLVDDKRFDLLIAAFARVSREFPEWDLRIAGDGPGRSTLEAQVRALNLADRVFLLGEVRDIGTLYAGASLFVLSSDIEVFPMALCEAMAAGRPALARAGSPGASDVVRDRIDGWVVTGGVAEMADGLRRLMGDPALRAELGRAAEAVTERFSLARVRSAWDDLFDGLEGLHERAV
jgi:glycosyltransferase involved in cell wall biosynthesis